MASGPDHYREAQECITYAMRRDATEREERYFLAAAQVHATLALVAATAVNPAFPISAVESAAWRGALAPSQPAEEDDDG